MDTKSDDIYQLGNLVGRKPALASAVGQIARLHAQPLHKDQRDRFNTAIVAQLHRLPMFQFTEWRRAG